MGKTPATYEKNGKKNSDYGHILGRNAPKKQPKFIYSIIRIITILLFCSCVLTSPSFAILANKEVGKQEVEQLGRAWKWLQVLLAIEADMGARKLGIRGAAGLTQVNRGMPLHFPPQMSGQKVRNLFKGPFQLPTPNLGILKEPDVEILGVGLKTIWISRLFSFRAGFGNY